MSEYKDDILKQSEKSLQEVQQVIQEVEAEAKNLYRQRDEIQAVIDLLTKNVVEVQEPVKGIVLPADTLPKPSRQPITQRTTEAQARNALLAHRHAPFTVAEYTKTLGLRDTSHNAGKNWIFKFIAKGMVKESRPASKFIPGKGIEPALYVYVKPSAQTQSSQETIVPRSQPVPGTGKAGKLTSNKEVNQILMLAMNQGAKARKLNNGHIVVTNPSSGKARTISATPSSSSLENMKRDMRQLGYNV